MQIGPVGGPIRQPDRVRNQKGTDEVPGRNLTGPSPAYKLDIGREATFALAVRTLLDQMPEVREDVVANVAQAIEKGTFVVDSRTIAEVVFKG